MKKPSFSLIGIFAVSIASLLTVACQHAPYSTRFFGGSIYAGHWNPRQITWSDMQGRDARRLTANITPEALAYDPAGQDLYIAFGNIIRRDLDKGGLTTFHRTEQAVDLAIDPIAGHLYWVEYIPKAAGRMRIRRCDLVTGANPVTIIGSTNPRGAIALDLERKHLYWAANAETGTPRGIYRSNLDGTGIEVVQKFMLPDAIAVDSRAGRLLWSVHVSRPGNKAVIITSDLKGENAETLIERPNVIIEDILIDPSTGGLIWQERAFGHGAPKGSRICRSDKYGGSIGTIREIGAGSDFFRSIAVGAPPLK